MGSPRRRWPGGPRSFHRTGAGQGREGAGPDPPAPLTPPFTRVSRASEGASRCSQCQAHTQTCAPPPVCSLTQKNAEYVERAQKLTVEIEEALRDQDWTEEEEARYLKLRCGGGGVCGGGRLFGQRDHPSAVCSVSEGCTPDEGSPQGKKGRCVGDAAPPPPPPGHPNLTASPLGRGGGCPSPEGHGSPGPGHPTDARVMWGVPLPFGGMGLCRAHALPQWAHVVCCCVCVRCSVGCQGTSSQPSSLPRPPLAPQCTPRSEPQTQAAKGPQAIKP